MERGGGEALPLVLEFLLSRGGPWIKGPRYSVVLKPLKPSPRNIFSPICSSALIHNAFFTGVGINFGLKDKCLGSEEGACPRMESRLRKRHINPTHFYDHYVK